MTCSAPILRLSQWIDAPNHYEVLGLTPQATAEQIQSRALDLIRQTHPDLPDHRGDLDQYIAALRARDVLTNPERRAGYDSAQSGGGLTWSTLLDAASLPAIERHLNYWGFTTFTLDGTLIHDGATFIAQAYHRLPNPYGYTSGRSWDAFLDVLRDGFVELEGGRVAILWTHVENMLDHGLSDLLMIHSVLEDFREEFEGKLMVFLLGEGPNFPPLPIDEGV